MRKPPAVSGYSEVAAVGESTYLMAGSCLEVRAALDDFLGGGVIGVAPVFAALGDFGGLGWEKLSTDRI